MSVVAGPALSFASTVAKYFSPSKSPFYSVVAFGSLSLVLSCEEISADRWAMVVVPIYVVLIVSLQLSFQKSHLNFTQREFDDQMKFVRSFSISSALISFVLTAREVEIDSTKFFVNFIACNFQILIFLLYTYARSLKEEESSSQVNFVQFALITTTFLIGASYSLAQSIEMQSAENESERTSFHDNYLLVALGLYLLWAICAVR